MKLAIKNIILISLVISILSTSIFTSCYFEYPEESDTLNSETLATETAKSTKPKKTDAKIETEKETEAELSAIDKLRPDYNYRTCKNLSGDVSVVLFYVDDFESSWTDSEIEAFTKNEVEPALSFLEKEAEKHGIELSFTLQKIYSSIYYDDEVSTSIALTGYATCDVLWQSAIQINYSSSGKMLDSFRRSYKTDEVVCFTIFNKSGTAYALNPARGYDDMNIDEHCLVFARDIYQTENGAAGIMSSVVAHEMLHLFGAEDFYANDSRKNLAKAYYPKDIMLSTSYDITENEVGKATAFYIGWTDDVPSILYNDKW